MFIYVFRYSYGAAVAPACPSLAGENASERD